MPKKGRTNRTKKRKSRANRTRLSAKVPTGTDKPTSRKTSGDTLKIKQIKRIISHPETSESKPETAAGNGTEQAEESVTDEDADYSDIEVEPEEDEPEEEGYVPTPEELEEEEELGAYYPDSNPDFATGYTFEDLKMVHKVIATDDADEQEKQQAREVLPA